MNFSGVFGILLVAGVFLADVLLGGSFFLFNIVYTPAFMVCLFGTLGLCYVSYGALETLKGVSALRYLVLDSSGAGDLSGECRVLSGGIWHLYVCGAAGTAIAVLKMLSHSFGEEEFIWAQSPLMVAVLPLFYSFAGAEFILRPLARRLKIRNNGS